VAQRALVRNVESGELRADLPLVDVATAIALAPDGGSLAAGGEAVDLLPLDGGPPRRLAEPAEELVDEVGFSPDGSLLTVVWRDGAIARYDVETGERLLDVPATVFTPVSALSADGTLVRLIDANTGPVLEADLTAADPSPQQTSDGANGAVGTAIGPDGIRATAFSDGVVGVGGGEAEPFRFQLASAPTSLSFSPDGRLLVAAANDGTVTVRSVAERTEVARLRVRDLGSEPLAAAFRPAGEPVVAIAAVDGSLTLWRVGVDVALDEACRVAARNLTVEEWDRYVGSIRPHTATCPAFPLDR
jgi:WD40 repeat protein